MYKKWFDEGQDYDSGLKLLERLQPKNNKLQFLRSQSQKPTPVARNMLNAALERAARISGQVVETNEPKASISAPKPELQADVEPDIANPEFLRARIIKDNPNFKFDDLSPEMQDVYNEIGADYKKMSAVHSKLKLEGLPAAERKQAAKLAAQLDDHISANYRVLDSWINEQRNAGNEETINESSDTPDLSDADKMKRLANLRSYISRDSLKLSKLDLDSDKYIALSAKIEAYKIELAELELWKESL